VNSTKINKQLQKLRSEEEKCIAQLEGYCQEYIQAAKNFVYNWYTSCVENAVKSYPEITQKIGSDGVQSLKDELTQFIQEIPKITEEALNQAKLWSHRHKEANKSLQSYSYSEKRPKMIDDVVRLILSRALPLLDRHGYEEAADNLDMLLANPFGYANELDWSPTMHTILNNYSTSHQILLELSARIKTAEEELIAAEARELWDSTVSVH
jgi:hypothetical protein